MMANMEIQRFEFNDLCLLTPPIFYDDRGFFCERFKEKTLKDFGVKEHFIQDNFSRSKPNVLRGMHYQSDPAQSKLVTCITGSIQDVVVDLRTNQPTFGKYFSTVLSAENPQWLYVPTGFAHGFLVLSSEGADVIYKVNAPYTPSSEASIAWNDSFLNIDWKCKNPILNSKDRAAPSWGQFLEINPF